MSTATIPLAYSEYEPARLKHGYAFVSEKYDGVPVTFTFECDYATDEDIPVWNLVCAVTRQGKAAQSVAHIARALEFRLDCIALYPVRGTQVAIVGEVMHHDFSEFKDVSGRVRRSEADEQLYIKLWDACILKRDGTPTTSLYSERRLLRDRIVGTPSAIVTGILEYTVTSADMPTTVPTMLKEVVRRGGEGLIVRCPTHVYEPGVRSPLYQKVLVRPTLDLNVVGVEEGNGKNAGAVGAVLCVYGNTIVRAGAGKLTYDERKRLWSERVTPLVGDRVREFNNGWSISPRMACIQYKRDQSYNALREPTFQCWRPDKKEPDA